MGYGSNQQCIENPPSVPAGGTSFNTLADCQANCSITVDPACQAAILKSERAESSEEIWEIN
jgi:hypothetical protein